MSAIDLANKKLSEAKEKVKFFALDYDGTISDIAHKQPEVMALVERVVSANKSVAFVTASASTAIKRFYPLMREVLIKTTGVDASCFIAGGNGTALYQVKKDSLAEIYNHGFNLAQVIRAADGGKKVYESLGIARTDLVEKGLETFTKFMTEGWNSYVPAEIIDVCRPYEGVLFTEEAKVTFVLPKDKSLHKKVIASLNSELGGEYIATAGDDTYVHITKKLHEDSKTVAVKTILGLLGLSENEVVTFGDMPNGNDVGLLSFPYSFTNSDDYVTTKHDPEKPPYVLADDDLSPVSRVYKAIECMLI